MKNKASLDHWLRMFNRKERYHLLVNALANISGNFEISSDYKSEIQNAVNLENKNHHTVFVAMDYHLDWMQVALECWSNNRSEDCLKQMTNKGYFKANQQDVDLLVVMEKEQQYDLIMIEAKADSGWSNKQLKEKATRLKGIFGNGNETEVYTDIRPHFILSSPKESPNIELDNWPNWMYDTENKKPYFIELELPQRIRLTRTKSEENSPINFQFQDSNS